VTARAWHHAAQAAVCDVVEPWEHGTILRASRYPTYFDYNVVRVEEHPGMSAAALTAFADEGTPVAYAQLERIGRSAEIAQVYVRADHRGRGLGTAVTRAAIAAARDAEDLWIVADDEGRPKQLYARLGFRPEWRAVEALRLP
jgi:GNAT superfamily N-acetyltransferase